MLSTFVFFISLIYDSLPINLSISQFNLIILFTLDIAFAYYNLLVELSILYFALAIVILSDLSESSIL